MNNNISAMLSQHQRDALLSYYIGQYVPNSSNQYLKDNIKSAEDVYQYLLLDPLVTNEVPTSYVSSGIASIQQYINSMVMNVERNVNTSQLDADMVEIWCNGASQYNIWASEVELDTYPENYIDPTLRQGQTQYFRELTTDLSQNALGENSAQQAIMSYLNKFEQVANLDIISGYFDGTDQLSSVYYLLGRTKMSPYKYYWRSFDMAKNINNTVLSDAWSEWKSINVAFNTEALVGTIRPVFLNNRLYLFWFEMIKDGQTTESQESSTFTINAWCAYYDLSEKWSAPILLTSVDKDVTAGNISELIESLKNGDAPSTVVVNCMPEDASKQPYIALSLYSKNDSLTEGYAFFSVKLDYWMNVVSIGMPDLMPLYSRFDGDNQKAVQHIFSLNQKYNVSCTKLSSKECNLLLGLIPSLNSSNVEIDESTGYVKNISTYINFDKAYHAKLTGMNSEGYWGRFWFKDYPEFPATGCDQRVGLVGEKGKNDPILLIGSKFRAMIETIEPNQDTAVFSVLHDAVLTFDNPDGDPGHASVFYGSTLGIGDSGVIECSRSENKLYPIDLNPGTPRLKFSDGYFVDYLESENLNTNAKYEYQNTELRAYQDAWGKGSIIGKIGPSANLAPCTLTGTASGSFSTLTYSYGIYVDDEHVAWHSYYIEVSAFDSIKSPVITTGVATVDGSAIYLDFTDSQFSNGTAVNPIRLNTLFAKELINKASISIDSLLDWKTQFTKEPPLSKSEGQSVSMDFHGANGLYFWELFFHMSHLVAWRLNEEGKYEDAQRWLHYIFNPAAQGRISNDSTIPAPPDYWNVRALVEQPAAEAQGMALRLTTDVDALAKADPQHYQKTIFMAYLRNLIAAGDNSYRQYTNDGLSLARLYYHQAKTLLGPRPDTRVAQYWQPDTLSSIEDKASESRALRQYEWSLPESTLLLAGSVSATMNSDGTIFMAPLNTQLIGYWDTIDARVYNLHHNLTLEGLPMSVPLFAQPVNPTLLLQQAAQGGSLTATINQITSSLPPYRFRTMLQSAKEAAGTLAQMGQTLLSYCERKDATSLQELDQQQLFNLSNFTIALEQSAMDALDAEREALYASRTSAINRYNHFNHLFVRGVTGGEAAAMALQTSASILAMTAAPFYAAGMISKTIPNIFGFACGGQEIGAPVLGAGVALQMSSDVLASSAQQIQTSEGYKRRSEEWEIQSQQAQDEISVIDRQLDALAVRRQAANTSLKLAQAQQKNLSNTLNFLSSRFTRAELYSWLCGQISALYYQAYDAVLALCMTTEACWQYEMGDITTRFIQTNAWNDSYRGLLVGETLQLNLHQMESAWLGRNTRRLELTKTVSLKSLMADDNAWSQFISTGKIDFNLNEALYDADYPGHYLRQIKALSVTLPALIAPYQDICMMLTQTGSSVLLKPDVEGVKYLVDPKKGSSANVLKNPRASQQIAVSSGLNDAGVFELNFGDERYLPFEGTGAVSSWQIMFPNATSAKQKALLESLNDVIIQVHYTAKNGGENFSHSVMGL
ncbi:neuraminidase-like domain-containing protein [Nissabacter sp. SGAir0207]|uniref:Tc toxin subunit A-related protein n=1 Tax=Nissabacter sp. SGAir0207 TaxID=2126321 RepID=UPI0010F75093|nr:neuraminidase-like domain-containing protein [Nissabacter sp. SGAir0207]